MQVKRSGAWRSSGDNRFDVAVTSLAGLAFLAAGEAPGRGKFASAPWDDPLRKAIEFVLRSQARKGPCTGLYYEYGEGPLSQSDLDRPMHGHGFALLFLAEAYGQSSSPELRARIHASLKAGVACTTRAQSDLGGWHYLPYGNQDEGSVTVTQIQGLRAARNVGIDVDRKVIDKAVEYIHKSQDATGGVKYTIRFGKPSLALTAAGMSVLYGAGEYADKGLEKGFRYIQEELGSQDRTKFFFYTQFYLAQALHQRGNGPVQPTWSGWYPAARNEIVRLQTRNKDWDDPYVGKAFGTACALLILEIPLRYLPIFQR